MNCKCFRQNFTKMASSARAEFVYASWLPHVGKAAWRASSFQTHGTSRRSTLVLPTLDADQFSTNPPFSTIRNLDPFETITDRFSSPFRRDSRPSSSSLTIFTSLVRIFYKFSPSLDQISPEFSSSSTRKIPLESPHPLTKLS